MDIRVGAKTQGVRTSHGLRTGTPNQNNHATWMHIQNTSHSKVQGAAVKMSDTAVGSDIENAGHRARFTAASLMDHVRVRSW